MRRRFLLSGLVTVLCLFLLFIGKTHAKEKFDRYFTLVKTVPLSTSAECALGDILDFEVDSKGNFIIDDAYHSQAIYVFSHDGDFITQLGQTGQGPGEYNEPSSIAVSPVGEIYICDSGNSRICIYDQDYVFNRQVNRGKQNHRNIHVNSHGELFAYNGMLHPARHVVFDTVIKFNTNGEEILSFALLQEEVLKSPMCSMRDGVAIDEQDYIYECNPVFYQIRKFDSEGNGVKTFERETKLFKMVTDEDETAIVLNGPYYLKGGRLVIQLVGHIEIFDTSGKLVGGEIPFVERIIGSHADQIYTMIWPHEQGGDSDDNPIIKVYKLK